MVQTVDLYTGLLLIVGKMAVLNFQVKAHSLKINTLLMGLLTLAEEFQWSLYQAN
ncbi:MAG TPA: hypothetical protein VEY70_21485 [Metabacillus sp.]|nr:hypothetical protein [Metabacillus sp.]